MSNIRDTLAPPYWAVEYDELPAHDFCKEVWEPKTSKIFPSGAVGVRVDADFWAVAALPYSMKNVAIQELVADLWPEIKDPAFYIPETDA